MADKSLKVVGAGYLGIRVAILWKQQFPDSKIYLKTRSDNANRSARFKASGFIPLAQENEDTVKTAYVVFCAPATMDPSYGTKIGNSVAEDWTREGNYVFTSSGGVYVENAGGTVDESSEVKGETSHSKGNWGILDGEKAVMSNQGIVIRMAGLYTRSHGVHNYWLKGGRSTLPQAPNGYINLVHYDDAARAVTAALTSAKSEEGRLYLASDGNPIRRKDLIRVAKKCPDYKDCNVPEFGGDPDIVNNKKYIPSKIMTELGWKPVFESLDKFMSEMYDQEMDVSSLVSAAGPTF